uniref:Uncharacterized protein n=1 Tax=viral metagenome TaxID=1070528 RepID=A0A6H1ZKF6_9ZZZZ
MKLYCKVEEKKTDHKQHSKIRREFVNNEEKWMVEMVCLECSNVKDCDFSQDDIDGGIK